MRTDFELRQDAFLRYRETVARLRSLPDDQFAALDPAAASAVLPENVVLLLLGESEGSRDRVLDAS